MTVYAAPFIQDAPDGPGPLTLNDDGKALIWDGTRQRFSVAALTAPASVAVLRTGGGGGTSTIAGATDFAGTPGAGTDGYAIVWDDGAQAFTLAAFDAAGTAAAAVAAHVALSNPHDQYELESANDAAAILTKLLTVDGAGSGLDADLLDGNSSAAFLRASGADTGGQNQLQFFNNGVRSDSGLSVGINPINALTLYSASADYAFGATIYNQNTTGTAARAGLTLNNNYYNATMSLNGAGVPVSGFNNPHGFIVLNPGSGGIDFAATYATGRIGLWVSSNKAMEIASSGNVGIGTDAPSSLLDVAGTIQADGLRLDVTPTSETITPTHTITFSANGTNYKIPCVAA